MSSAQTSVGEHTSLSTYMLYVGNGLQMLTYANSTVLIDNCPHVLALQIFLCKIMFLSVSTN